MIIIFQEDAFLINTLEPYFIAKTGKKQISRFMKKC